MTTFRLLRDIGLLKKGDHVTVVAVASCCNGAMFLVKKVDEEIFQYAKQEDLKKL
jgi:hypothetical protein